MRLDSQATGPGESYNLEIEGGAGGVQQAAGDFLWHCHIAHHYLSGMWAFWRTYDTLQPDLMPLPDRAARAAAVDSAGLIGRTMPDGTVITKDNLDSWIRPQLPPQGKKNNTQERRGPRLEDRRHQPVQARLPERAGGTRATGPTSRG